MDNTIDKTPISMLHLLTKSEAAILDAAEVVKFGELLNVEIVAEEPKIFRKLTAVQVAFIKALRDQGAARFDTIIVHNGTPSQIEILGTAFDIKYKRKIRFN